MGKPFLRKAQRTAGTGPGGVGVIPGATFPLEFDVPAATATTSPTPPPDVAARPRLRPWLGTAARLLLAVVWAWAAVSKLGDPAASVRAVRAYQLLPEWLAKAVGYGLPFLELGLAALLLAGLATRVAAVLS
jgi:hypothetical protein